MNLNEHKNENMKKLGIIWILMALARQRNYIGFESIIEIDLADR
jgi:hypothetical protein